MGFSDILKGQSMEVKLKYVDLLAESVKDEKQGFLAIKILARLLKIAFDGKTGHPEIENLSDVIDYLEKKHDLLNNIFKNLTDYMIYVGKELEKAETERPDLASDPHTKVISGHYTHSDQIT